MDKIKQFWVGVKEAFIYILGPFAFLAGVLYYLATRKVPSSQKEEEKFDGDHAETVKAEEQADKAASDATAEYERIKSELLKGGGLH